jgi:elongation factor G
MKDVGCQRLFKDIIDFIPAPKVLDSDHLRAIAFKVVSDEQRGLLTFVRLYSGKLSNKSMLHLSGNRRERVQKVMRAHGQDLVEIDAAGAGEIAVIGGCREVATGDTLSDTSNFEPLPGVIIPQPVFHMAVSTDSISEQDRVEEALRIMSLEDPSLKISKDQSTGQTIMSGMGELHLEIARNRLVKAFKCRAEFGPVRIAVKEVLTEQIKGELQYERTFNSLRQSALVGLHLEPLPVDEEQFVNCKVEFDIMPDSLRIPKYLNSGDFFQSVKDGVNFALLSGPLRGSPVTGLKVIVKKAHWIDNDTTPTSIRHATTQLVSHDDPNSDQIVEAEAPLSELMGYVTWLRTTTSGRGCLSMTLKGYKQS